jgi:selenide,water dikinase
MKDLAKRKRIMQRSIHLGHCICDPKKPCPCDLLRDRDVCLCAGERIEADEGPVRLTQLVENAGCASKIDQAALKSILADLPQTTDPHVLVGMAAGDDAGVYQLDNGLALVQTVDVFCPSVDDPYEFGQVAAANSLSDVYAMGGRPITALSIIGFPIRQVSDRVMADILRGGMDKMAEAGVAVIGGHSIKDKEIKAGFAVTGLVDPRRVATNAAALPGDALVLTKPLGTGIVAFASQIGRASVESQRAAAESMTALNKTASELMVKFAAHACTDITGFGLIGHVGEMARSSRVDIEIIWDDLPLLPGVIDYVADEIISGGIERNRESSAGCVTMGRGTVPGMLDVCLDPQTSGGLLVALPAENAAEFVRALHAAGIAAAAIIGRVRDTGTGRVYIETRGERKIPDRNLSQGKKETQVMATTDPKSTPKTAAASSQSCCSSQADAPQSCCAGGAGPADASSAGAPREKFLEFLREATGKPGALSVRNKEAVTLALAIATRCGPCIKVHLKKAAEMGFTPEEIEELAALAIAFGGAPVMMFYDEAKKLPI